MIFQFIKYVQPAWQFNLQPSTTELTASCIVNEAGVKIDFLDKSYQTKSAQLADAGYRLWNQGLLLQSSSKDLAALKRMEPPTLEDEYKFIRKYWGFIWATHALLIRLFTFKNPLNELKAFYKTKHIKRENQFINPVLFDNYSTFSSDLLAKRPLVSIIIPTLNRYQYLKDALEDLQKQTYSNFEVIIIDQSDDFDNGFYSSVNLNIKLIRQSEKLLWTARNNAIKTSSASYLLFFDDDSRVEPDWVMEHLKCIDYFNADISAGVSKATVGGKVAESYNYFRWADQFDSGNALVKRTVFEKIGLFDEQFNGMRMGDGEFGYRAFINGFSSISNYKAPRVHLKVSDGGLREMGSWDGFRPTKWLAPKPIPSVIYLYRKYLPKTLADNGILLGILLSNIPYKHKRNKYMLLISLALSVLKLPLLFIQYFKANKIANVMLRNKSLPIEILPLRPL